METLKEEQSLLWSMCTTKLLQVFPQHFPFLYPTHHYILVYKAKQVQGKYVVKYINNQKKTELHWMKFKFVITRFLGQCELQWQPSWPGPRHACSPKQGRAAPLQRYTALIMLHRAVHRPPHRAQCCHGLPLSRCWYRTLLSPGPPHWWSKAPPPPSADTPAARGAPWQWSGVWYAQYSVYVCMYTVLARY